MVKFIDPVDGVQEYKVVNELNLKRGIISLEHRRRSESGPYGGWYTHLPVSSPGYQEKHHRTLAAVTVFVGVDEITFNIIDDYGLAYVLTITGDEIQNPIVQDEVKIIGAIQGK